MDRPRLAVVALLAGVAFSAGAHEDPAPKRDAITIGPSEIVVTLDYAVPRGDLARTLRAIFDRDHSGALDDGEAARLGAHLTHEAAAFVALTVDGAAVALAIGAPVVDVTGARDDAIAVHAEAVARVALAKGAHRIRFADRHKDRRLVVPVRVALQPGVVWVKRPLPQPIVDEKRVLDLAVDVVDD